MVKGKQILDMRTGKIYKSQYAMIKALFPCQKAMNPFYMYHAYKIFPGRFIINGVVQYGGYKMHWDISTKDQVMVNCGMDWTYLKTTDLTKVTCKNCLRTAKISN